MSGQTDPEINRLISVQTDCSVAYFSAHRDEIPWRLRELDQEWDIERALETGSSSLSLVGLTLGVLGRRRWLLLSLVVQGFFLQHALQGWCPPLPLLRKLGFRTQQEIDDERARLIALRDDASQRAATPGFGTASPAPEIVGSD